ncbi:MAG: helix-turn-helix domain-containing protein [Afipia sp.]|nr:helix-turn-helix domain-containing protein [Afipia sp.]
MRALNSGRPDRFMLISSERVFYAGLHGKPSVRALGALAVCVPLHGTARLEIAGQPPRVGEILAVPAYVPHKITSESREVLGLLIEPESVCDEDLAEIIRQCDDPVAAGRLAARFREIYATMALSGTNGFTSADFDQIFLQRRLRPRDLDARISAIVSRFQAKPSSSISGEDCANDVRLSLSRFLHLFKDETSMNFKTFRAWKRGRNILHHVNVERNLAHFALDAGYPDSTHFSHSLRRIYGLQPSAIFSGSRRLQIINGRDVAPEVIGIRA